jgi:hypothetical protein
MKTKFAISVEELFRRYESLKEIEQYELGEILFFENGKPVDILSKDVEDFEFTGLVK